MPPLNHNGRHTETPLKHVSISHARGHNEPTSQRSRYKHRISSTAPNPRRKLRDSNLPPPHTSSRGPSSPRRNRQLPRKYSRGKPRPLPPPPHPTTTRLPLPRIRNPLHRHMGGIPSPTSNCRGRHGQQHHCLPLLIMRELWTSCRRSIR